ncbi:hypothetical protein I4F81_001165 [Pyropia yezoensis]|uniref:Uncharacterized protein n=1 Tax=Pyropia yezoensis TaxID=2788 RepID=A0ACC3BLH3_PYRYE|nr:hypothetical protein I4F81_001165 [Neopyropia yezoensis]
MLVHLLYKRAATLLDSSSSPRSLLLLGLGVSDMGSSPPWFSSHAIMSLTRGPCRACRARSARLARSASHSKSWSVSHCSSAGSPSPRWSRTMCNRVPSRPLVSPIRISPFFSLYATSSARSFRHSSVSPTIGTSGTADNDGVLLLSAAMPCPSSSR